MTGREINTRLDAIDVDDDAKLDALATEARLASREMASAIAKRWASADREDDLAKSRAILRGLMDLAIIPLLESNVSDVYREDWMMTFLVESILKLHVRIGKYLDAAMQDKRLIPALPPIGEEIKPPSRRICDDAYLLARRLLNTAETKMQGSQNENEFLSFPNEKKDKEIETYLKTRQWKRFVQDVGI